MAEVSTTTEVRERTVRRIPKIVFERPQLDVPRLLLLMVAGALVGFVGGWLLTWLAYSESADFATVMRTTRSAGWWPAWTSMGALAGLLFGWGLGRTATPRIEMVEVTTVSRQTRRRARTSALARTS